MWAIISRAVAIVVLAVATISTAAPSAHAASPVELQLSPSTITLTGTQPASGILGVSSTSKKPLTVKITSLATSSAVEADLGPVSESGVRVPAGGSVAVPFTVNATEDFAVSEAAVTFTARTSDSASTYAVSASLTVKRADPIALVLVETKTKLETLDEFNTGRAIVLVSNQQGASVKLSSIRVVAPPQVRVTVECPTSSKVATVVQPGHDETLTDCEWIIPGRGQEPFPITLEPADAVAPGPRSLLILFSAQLDSQPTEEAPQIVTATVDFTVGLYAQDAILKVLGVPAFFLIPGLIAIIVCWWLLNGVGFLRNRVPVPGDVFQTVTFVTICGVAVSLAFAAIYPTLTQHLWSPTGTWPWSPSEERFARDYLRRTGFTDLYGAYVYAFLAAIVVWLAVQVMYGLWWKVWGAKRFLPRDELADTLRKIATQGGSLELPPFDFKRGDKDGVRGFLLDYRQSDRAAIATPGINILILNATVREREALNEAVTGDHAGDLWNLLEPMLKDARVKLISREDAFDRTEVVTGVISPTEPLPLVEIVDAPAEAALAPAE